MSLSRLYDDSQPPGRHARYITLKQLYLSHRSLFCSVVFALKVDEFTCCVLCHSSRFKQSVPRFPLYTLFSFDLKERERRRWYLILTSCKINSLLFVVQEINPPLKNPPGKTSDFLHKLYLGNEADLSKKKYILHRTL